MKLGDPGGLLRVLEGRVRRDRKERRERDIGRETKDVREKVQVDRGPVVGRERAPFHNW